MKNRVLSQAIIPEGAGVSVVDGLIAFNISEEVVGDEVTTWLRRLRSDEATTYPFVINVYDIDGPLLIECDDDLKSYLDVWVTQHEED
jgi:hypothetical protein